MNKGKIILIIFCICLPLLLLLTSYKLVIFFTEYTSTQQQTLDFLTKDNNLTLNLTKAEYSHLEDVQEVMVNMDFLFYFLLFICVLIFTYYQKNDYLLVGGIVTITFLIFFSLISLLNFNLVFTIFHQLFFPQGNWIFAVDSFLIRTFPITFFIFMTQKIVSLTFLLATFFIGIGYFLKRR